MERKITKIKVNNMEDIQKVIHKFEYPNEEPDSLQVIDKAEYLMEKWQLEYNDSKFPFEITLISSGENQPLEYIPNWLDK